MFLFILAGMLGLGVVTLFVTRRKKKSLRLLGQLGEGGTKATLAF